jgi:predicted RNase H-like nuclease
VIAVGLDGFRDGWVAVCLDETRAEIRFLKTIRDLRHIPFDRAAVDIPIGMPESGYRACDQLARQMLRPHWQRVFTGARRALWEFESAAAANAALRQRGEAGISLQLWNLGPKIMEVDAFVREHRHHDVRETHPELVFQRLNRGQPLSSKKTVPGLERRRELLLAAGFAAADLDAWLNVRRAGTGAKVDDVLDACATALAARDAVACIPGDSAPTDAFGVPMQIWF